MSDIILKRPAGAAPAGAAPAAAAALPVLMAVSLCHLLNDMLQVLLPAIYPLLKGGFHLNFAEIGLITLIYQITASLLQPLIGLYTDSRPQPYSLPVGMGFTMAGILSLAFAGSFAHLLIGAALLGVGSSVFHPESARIARAASGGKHGFAQSIFQVGGNFGQALGPLLAAFFILPRGRGSMAWFAIAALVAMAILSLLGFWFKSNGHAVPRAKRQAAAPHGLSRPQVTKALLLLGLLVFSKFFYLASINSYYIFYLMHRFHLSVQSAQIDLFVFLAAAAAGTLIGGPIGDRIGRRYVIWGSILGVLPFTLALPYVGLAGTIMLSVIIGLVLSSAFSSIIVYATELMPDRIGAISGLFFGLAFGLGGLGAAGLGVLADATSIGFVYRVCAFLPAIGLFAYWLPEMRRR